jgi:hypothetical protein
MQLDHVLPASPEVVYACLTDMQRFAVLHPVIYRIVELGNGRYRIHERMPGLSWLRFSYPAEVQGDTDKMHVYMQAKVFGLVRVRMVFELVPLADGCAVKESVDFQTWLPVKRRLERTFRAQHLQLFANIAAAYPASPPASR